MADATVEVVRIATVGKPAFQLRKGEEGISVFVPSSVEPPLSDAEILDQFRVGSAIVVRVTSQIEEQGLLLLQVDGAENLTDRLRQAHHEIRPGAGMNRDEFKRALKELEP